MRGLVWRIFRGRMRPLVFNLFPAYRGTGGRVTFVSDDFREIRVELPLNRRTRNYVGTIFGGSMYAAVDPFFMIMLIEILGPDYVVWDKAASIRFRRPGKETLHARFVVPPEETDAIRRALESGPSVDRVYTIDLADGAGLPVATVEKTIYVRRREAPAAGNLEPPRR